MGQGLNLSWWLRLPPFSPLIFQCWLFTSIMNGPLVKFYKITLGYEREGRWLKPEPFQMCSFYLASRLAKAAASATVSLGTLLIANQLTGRHQSLYW